MKTKKFRIIDSIALLMGVFAIGTAHSQTPGASLRFDGNNDYVNLGTASELDVTGDITVETWIKPDAGASGTFFFNGGGYNIGGYAFHLFGPNLVVEVRNGGSVANVSNAVSIAGAWHHVAFTRQLSTGSIKVYLDGVLLPTQGTFTLPFGLNTGICTIGAYIGGSGAYFEGSLDETRIWNRVLCDDELIGRMNCEIPTNALGLLGNYHYNHGISASSNSGITTLQDATTPNTTNGTATGFSMSGTASNWMAPGGVVSGVSCTYTAPAVIVSAVGQTSPTCVGGSNGTASVTASGGLGLTYNWTPGNPTGDGTASVTGLTAGTWTCTVTNSCGGTGVQVFNIAAPSGIVVSASATEINCNGGTAAVTVSATSGTAPYTGIGMFTALAGLHNYTVTDANGCAGSTAITITEPNALVASSAVTSIDCSGDTAVITVSASGGTFPYTGTGTNLVAPGTFSYTVTDSKGCSSLTSSTFTAPSPLVANSSATAITCNGSSALVTISANGGTAPYSGNDVVSALAGEHTYTVTDANGCQASTSITITQPAPLTANASATQINCYGGSSTVTVSGNGGTAPYVGEGVFTELPGSPVYTITDANGCQATSSPAISQPDSLQIQLYANPISCSGGLTYVYIGGIGGTTPYTGNDLVQVPAGIQTFTITDANGCTSTGNLTVVEPAPIVVTTAVTSDILCNGGIAEVSIAASGGIPPYANTGSYTFGAGEITWYVYDANGCQMEEVFTITQPDQLTLGYSAGTIACNGGTTDLTITTTGGTAPFTGTETIMVSAGWDLYTVTDANGCSASIGVDFTEPTVLDVSSPVTAMTCPGTSVEVEVLASGGTAPYVGAGIYNENAGNQTYTVTDGNGCTATTSTTVVELAEIDDATTTSGATITATAVNVTYQWINCATNAEIAGATSQDYTATANGDYAVVLTSTDNCTDTSDCVTIDVIGINEITTIDVNVYPNPTNNEVTISMGEATALVEVMDLNGKVLAIKTIENNQKLSLASYETGVYFLRITTKNGFALKRVIKE
jgi:hypothetical protein